MSSVCLRLMPPGGTPKLRGSFQPTKVCLMALQSIEPGMTILSPSGEAHTVTQELAQAFEPGDRLVANAQAGLLRIPAAERRIDFLPLCTGCSGAVTNCHGVSP